MIGWRPMSVKRSRSGTRVLAVLEKISKHQPVKVILDGKPNFPFSPLSNRISIYYLQKL